MARTSNNGGGETKAPKAAAKTPARRRSDKTRQPVTAVAHDSGSLTASVAALTGTVGGPNPAEVARVAYELYLQRGCCDGYDQEDWYEAERRLRGR